MKFYNEIEILLLLNDFEQNQFWVYENHQGNKIFDWGAHKCENYLGVKNAFLIGRCKDNEQVFSLLNNFDSTFGTKYVNGKNISSKIILKYKN
jgi:hypothetical protein